MNKTLYRIINIVVLIGFLTILCGPFVFDSPQTVGPSRGTIIEKIEPEGPPDFTPKKPRVMYV